MNNISQHLFVPLEQLYFRHGYWAASGSFQANQLYNTYPVMDYPNKSVVNVVYSLSDTTSSKLRYWTSTTQSSQTNRLSYVPYLELEELSDMTLFAPVQLADEYAVKSVYFYLPQSVLPVAAPTVIKDNLELV